MAPAAGRRDRRLTGGDARQPIVYLLYVLLTYLAIPFVIAVEGWRSLKDANTRGRVQQRLGFLARPPRPGGLWIHAVSVGEVQAAAALVRTLRAHEPDLDIVLSSVTPTGAQRAQALFGDRVRHCYLPYDLPGAVRRFLDRLEPRAVVILETEIWPTLYRTLGRRSIPIVLASARLSERSVGRYRLVAALVRPALTQDVTIGAQTEADAERFRALGAAPERVQVTGNVKFDLQIPQSSIDAGRAFRRACGAARRVWIAGSTHEGEEEAALSAHAALCARHPGSLLLVAPRHPPRFAAVRALLDRRGVRYAQRSAGEVPAADHEVFLLDSLGELQAFYAAADLAFVGGTLVPVGGHNLLEPAVLGLPILSGPHTQNTREIADLLQDAGALTIVDGDGDLARRVIECFDDPARAQADGERGRMAVARSRGAVERLVAMIEPLLSPSGVAPASAPASSGSR